MTQQENEEIIQDQAKIWIIPTIIIVWLLMSLVLLAWYLISSGWKEPKIITDTKKLNAINLEDANDLYIKREAEARIQRRSETKAKLIQEINFNWE